MAYTKPGHYDLIGDKKIRNGNDWSITLTAPYSITTFTYTAYITATDSPDSVKTITVVKNNETKEITLSLTKSDIEDAELAGATWRWILKETSDSDFTKTIGESLIEFEE